MNFHLQAIKRACCRNETEIQQEKIQEQQARSFQTQRTLSPSQIPTYSTSNIQKHPSNPHKSPPPQLRYYREPPDCSFCMASIEHQQLQRQHTSPVRFLIIKEGLEVIQINTSKSPPIQQLFVSPQLSNQMEPRTRISFANSQKICLKQSARPRSPKVTFTLASKQQEPKTQSKRLKTQQQETEYSSKHSQIAFRNYNVASDPLQIPSLVTFKKHNSIFFQNKVIFQEQNQSFEYNQSLNCRQVSARYQIDHSFNNDFLNNARTIQSIVTSNEIKSKLNSRMPSILQDKKHTLLLFTPSSSKQHIKSTHQQSQTDRQNSQTHFRDYHSPLLSAERSISPPPSFNVSPKVQEISLSPNAQSNLFYGSNVAKKMAKSPKVSVLELNEAQENDQCSEAQQLRDVIDNNYLKSPYCSHSNSPILSINQSLKNLNQEKQKKVISFFKLSPEHSRQASNELQLFRQTMAKLKRTNTIESIESHSSENSCIDIKFMQRMRGRREVSHLV